MVEIWRKKIQNCFSLRAFWNFFVFRQKVNFLFFWGEKIFLIIFSNFYYIQIKIYIFIFFFWSMGLILMDKNRCGVFQTSDSRFDPFIGATTSLSQRWHTTKYHTRLLIIFNLDSYIPLLRSSTIFSPLWPTILSFI